MDNTVYVLEVQSNGVHGCAGIYTTNAKAIDAEWEYRKHFEPGERGVDTAIRPEKLDEITDFGVFLAARFGNLEV